MVAENTTFEPFKADGISLGIPNTNATDISSIDNALFLDSNGELHFRDNFTKGLGTDIDGSAKDSITLKDLYYRVKGVYAVDGKLYFKDSSVSRPYSLKELIGAYIDWKNKLSTGGIYWIGNTRVTGSECENIKVWVNGDPNLAINTTSGLGSRIFEKLLETGDYLPGALGTKTFSIDKYIQDYMVGHESDPNYYKFETNGSWKWHDVPNLQITVPPLDLTKALTIIAKTNVRLIKTNKPIVFRLYDVTAEEELDRKAVANDSSLPATQQPVLTYFGKLPSFTEKVALLQCQCPTSEQSATEDPPHIIKVQFHADDALLSPIYSELCQFDNTSILCIQGQSISGDNLYKPVENTENVKYHPLERRLIGLPNVMTTDPIIKSSIDVVVYDVSKEDSMGRKSGNLLFTSANRMDVIFNTPFTSSDYSISLSSNKNINMWFTNKKNTGFTIMAELKFSGTVDWIATKLLSEGEA